MKQIILLSFCLALFHTTYSSEFKKVAEAGLSSSISSKFISTNQETKNSVLTQEKINVFISGCPQDYCVISAENSRYYLQWSSPSDSFLEIPNYKENLKILTSTKTPNPLFVAAMVRAYSVASQSKPTLVRPNLKTFWSTPSSLFTHEITLEKTIDLNIKE